MPCFLSRHRCDLIQQAESSPCREQKTEMSLPKTSVTKERLRRSLNTRCVETARLRRDEIFAAFIAKGILAGSGCVSIRRG